MAMGTTYHRTPCKGNESAKKARAGGKSTQRLKKGRGGKKLFSKAATKSSLVTELFKSPTETPVKAKASRTQTSDLETRRSSARKTSSKKEVDIWEYLDEGVMKTQINKQVAFTSSSGGLDDASMKAKKSKPLELRTRKQTKAAKAKHRKSLKRSRTPRKKAPHAMAPRTPAKEPKIQEPLKNSMRNAKEDDSSDKRPVLFKIFAVLAPILTITLAGTRKLALRGA